MVLNFTPPFALGRPPRLGLPLSIALSITLSAALSACGGGAAGDSGPRVRDASQSISFSTAPALHTGATTALQASASSGLALSYASLTPDICSVDASSGRVTGLARGDCSISANQGGNENFAPAPQSTQQFPVIGREQALSFDAAPLLQVDGLATVHASASSGLAVRYSSQSGSLCSVDAQSGAVTGLASGLCRIAAEQPGDPQWAAAAPATLELSVQALAQSISFTALPALAVGAPALARATASSGLATRYASLTPAVCQVDPATGSLSILSSGSCSITANQSGDARWAAAAQASQTAPVSGMSQTLSFANAPNLVSGGSATVRASASSGLPVSYSALSPAQCTVNASSGLVTSLLPGACTIAANQAGNSTWSPAPQVVQTLVAGTAAQSIAFGAAPSLTVGASAMVHAAASSGLAISYASLSTSICSVQISSGSVSGLSAGNCVISANQSGNASWAAAAQVTQTLTVMPNPKQTISFTATPMLSLGGTATASAVASSGLPVSYSSLSPTVCSINGTSGLITGFSLGDCVIAANQAGNAYYQAAPQMSQTLPVQTPSGVTVPAAPLGVTATLGADMSRVILSLGSVASGGSPVTSYTVQSQPAGITVQSASAPVQVNCPGTCAGYTFTVYASNAIGQGAASATTEVLTIFDVLTRFKEPDTQPRDSIFTGRFTLNSSTGEISHLTGRLTESMTGNAVGSAPYYDMIQVTLNYQLQSWRDIGLGGRFVASFAKNDTSTFATVAGGDGWSPQAGVDNGGVYAGFPKKYPTTIQNSSILIFVPDNPLAPLTPAQLAKLAYADCAPGGMMGAVCMTGTSAAGYGAVGTMSGYPLSQQITRH